MPIQKVGPYDIFGTIGKGHFSKVKFAMNRESKSSVAVKILEKTKLRERGLMEATKNEIGIMKKLVHSNCVGICDMYANPDKIIIIMDLVMGVTLFQLYKSRKLVSEIIARRYLIQLVNGLQYCHDSGIILGGIELDGVLVESDSSLKISDFSRAIFIGDKGGSTACRKQVTPQFAAPELVTLESTCNEKTDIWTLGIVLFSIVAGFMPYDWKPLLPDMLRNISAGNHEPYPASFSPTLVGLLDILISVKPTARPSLSAVLDAPWTVIAEPADVAANPSNESSADENQQTYKQTMSGGLMCAITIPFVEYFPSLSMSAAIRSVSELCVPQHVFHAEMFDPNLDISAQSHDIGTAATASDHNSDANHRSKYTELRPNNRVDYEECDDTSAFEEMGESCESIKPFNSHSPPQSPSNPNTATNPSPGFNMVLP